jgi:hypothetical protein
MGSGAKLVRKKRSLRTVVQGYEHRKCLLADVVFTLALYYNLYSLHHLIADRKNYVVIVYCVRQIRSAVEFENPQGIS